MENWKPGRVHLKGKARMRTLPDPSKVWDSPPLIAITGMAGLAFDDGFAGRLAGWRQEMQTWEREFSTWTGQAAFRSPPSVPTVKRFGRTKDQALLGLRQAAYDVAAVERKEAHGRWAERSSKREKAYHAEYDRQRDWEDEATHREEERAEQAAQCRAAVEGSRCDCVRCEGMRERAMKTREQQDAVFDGI